MDRKKQQSKVLVMFSLIMSLLIVGTGGYYIIKTRNASTGVENAGYTKDEAYSIRNNATAYQKELYSELKEALKEEPVNDEKVAGLVAQNFVADFYTWTNKFRLNDIGGLQFVHEDTRTSAYQYAQTTTYQDLYYYLNNGGLDKTLEVTKVNVVSVTPFEFFQEAKDGKEEMYDKKQQKTIKGNKVSAYHVSLSWEYEETDKIKTSEYEKDALFTIVKNKDGLQMIAEVMPNE